MAFFKFRQRGQSPSEPRGRSGDPAPAGPEETIDSLRRRARQRLIGASVLVLVAIIGFPLLFDTQPRPVSIDAPITIPDRDSAPQLQTPGSSGSRVATGASLGEREEIVASGPSSSTSATPRTQRSAGSETPASRSTAPSAVDTRATEEAARARRDDAAAQARQDDEQQRTRREAEAKAKRDAEARAKREREAAEQRTRREEAARARAALEGRGANTAPAAAPATSAAAATSTDAKERFIVQVGAFAEPEQVREVRQQAERAGVKTYTQVIDTKDGKRTRVRVGPYTSRAEAEKAAAALKKAGLAGSILSL